jgi:hypothetical protein
MRDHEITQFLQHAALRFGQLLDRLSATFFGGFSH